MAMKSLLFVPGDSEKKLGKAQDISADIVIIDLEDSVTAENRPAARKISHDVVAAKNSKADLWVRINPLDSDDALTDLAAVMAAAPIGIMLPKAGGPEDIARLSDMISALEAAHDLPRGDTKILPVASETAMAALALPRYAAHHLPRLAGLTWGAEDLSAFMGASRKRDEQGHWTDIYRHVRTQCLLAAHAAGVAAIDTLFADFRNADGLADYASTAQEDGFSGMLAIHPAQVDIINQAFTPSDEAIAHAKAVVAAFADNPGAGAVQLNGSMLDMPHLKLAQRILSQQ